MRKHVLLLLMLVNVIYPLFVAQTYLKLSSPNLDTTSNVTGLDALSNVTISLAIYGNITNLGDEAIPLNETDTFIFEYPLKTPDQKVRGVRVWVNGKEYNYTLHETNTSIYLVILSPYFNKTLKPRETINVGVEYRVSVNMSHRLRQIIDFLKVSNPYELLSKAGNWSDLRLYINETTTKATSLWNYTHPLIKLLDKYLSRTINSDKPLGYLLGTLNWIDESIIYSVRIPPRFPWEVIVEGAGDCDDQANLLITLLRSRKIPSYLETGMIYFSEKFRYEDKGAGGYFRFKFIGGGGHGWVVAYIPPWGWLRIDPIVRSDLLTGEKAPLYKVAIKYALYYWFPTIVTGKVFVKDYVSESARSSEEIQARKIMIELVIEMHREPG